MVTSIVATAFPGRYRWFRSAQPTGLKEIVENHEASVMFRVLADVGMRIFCQWTPHPDDFEQSPSNYADIGPLKIDPSVQSLARDLLLNNPATSFQVSDNKDAAFTITITKKSFSIASVSTGKKLASFSFWAKRRADCNIS